MPDLDKLVTSITPTNRHSETPVYTFPGEVVHLVPPRREEEGANQIRIVEALERWLDEAKAGAFTQIAMVATHPGGEISTCYRTFYANATLQGALVNLSYRLAQEWNDS